MEEIRLLVIRISIHMDRDEVGVVKDIILRAVE